LLRFDSLGNDGQMQALPEGDDRAHDGSIHDPIEHIPYKALIYLELIQGQPLYSLVGNIGDTWGFKKSSDQEGHFLDRG
jgi:hypothetical protein